MSNTSTFLVILSHTPPWVWALFTTLVALGLLQARSRNVTLRRATALPLALIGLSLYGVFGSTGGQPVALLAWGLAVAVAVALHHALGIPRGVSWNAATQRFRVPGSWAPLLLMMAIFCTKFIAGVMLVVNPGVREQLGFAVGSSATFGLLSGSFFARALVLWQLARRSAPTRVAAQRTFAA